MEVPIILPCLCLTLFQAVFGNVHQMPFYNSKFHNYTEQFYAKTMLNVSSKAEFQTRRGIKDKSYFSTKTYVVSPY